MGFGAIVTTGEQNKLLQDDLVSRITEVRVEQTLGDPTRYAIRFEEDICAGEFEVMNAKELQPGAMVAVAVKAEADKLKCLVRGPITEMNSSSLLGGPGSWYEIRGEDRRVELDRQWIQRRWTGRASDAAQAILSSKFQTNIEQTGIIYGARRSQGREVLETLNQQSTDAWFVGRIAHENNLHFWLEYECKAVAETLVIKEIANFKPSPPRPEGATPENAAAVKLVPTTPLNLRVNVRKENCPNVTAFTLKVDAERPKRFSGAGIDDRSVQKRVTNASDRQRPITKGGQQTFGTSESEQSRNVFITAAGTPEEVQVKAESSLTEAGWFLHATASTTAHRLNGVLLPHDVIEIEGLGDVHSGPYQIQSVTHVINAADHYMDIELRRNAIGKK